MGRGALRRSINYAFARYEPVPFPRCDTCGEGPGRVRVKDQRRDRVWLICQPCAEKFLANQVYAQAISDLATERKRAQE